MLPGSGTAATGPVAFPQVACPLCLAAAISRLSGFLVKGGRRARRKFAFWDGFCPVTGPGTPATVRRDNVSCRVAITIPSRGLTWPVYPGTGSYEPNVG